MERRSYHCSRSSPWRAVHEPAIPRGGGSAAGPRSDNPGGPWCPQGAGDGRRIALAMKILVLGLDCAAPELLFGFEDLPNIRRLMEVRAYSPPSLVTPPITLPASTP